MSTAMRPCLVKFKEVLRKIGGNPFKRGQKNFGIFEKNHNVAGTTGT